jgi:DNA-binding NtrC family response regulator
MAVLEALGRVSPETAVVMLTAHGGVHDAVQAMKLGAADFMQKPFDRDELLFVIGKAARRRADVVDARRGRMLGDAPVMREVYDTIDKASRSKATVMIRGESGTGKELVAEAIHAASPRAAGPFVRVHCAALPDHLLESELFGYEKGAFTGAAARKPGRFELADGGTMLLDEIGDVSPATQVKLLRVLQQREIERLGGTRPVPVDVRVVVATHRSLETMVARGEFREDLFYRLNVIPIWLPPLRERVGDIPTLARAFLAEAVREHGLEARAWDEGGLDALGRHDWPGNIRQLRNVVERLAVMADGPVVGAREVLRELGRDRVVAAPDAGVAAAVAAVGEGATDPMRVQREQAELQAIRTTLDRCGGNRTTAARLLGVSRRTLYNRLERFGMI